MNTLNSDLVVAVYDWHSSVERAIQALHDAGCNMRRVSVVGRNGAFLGRLRGMLNAGNFREATSLTDALSTLGFPGKSVSRYETALKANDFILVAHGDERDVYRVRELLETSGFVTLDHVRVPEEVPHAA